MKKTMKFSHSLRDPASKVAGLIRSSSRPGTKVAVAALTLTTVAILAFTAALVVPPIIRANNDEEATTFTVDVLQTASSNAQNDVDPAEGKDVFTRGDTFIIDGTVYPAGTIPGGKAMEPDPNVQPIGKYRIRGTYTVDVAEFQKAAAHLPHAAPIMAFASELFSLSDDGTTILTDGLWPNAYFSTHREVLGGTGRFRYAVGEVYEENIGENKDGFCNLRVTFKLRKVDDGHRR